MRICPLRRQLVQPVVALRRDPGMHSAQSVNRLAPILRSLHLARDTALDPLQVLLLPLQRVQRRHALTVRRRREQCHAEVDPQCRHQPRRRDHVRLFHLDRHEPAAPLLCQRPVPNLALDRLRLTHPHPAQLRWLDALVLSVELAVRRLRKPQPRILAPTPEPRIAAIPLEEAPVARLQPFQRLLLRLHGGFGQPRRVRVVAPRRQPAAHRRIAGELLTRRPQSLLLADGPVPHPAARPGEPAQGVRGAGCGAQLEAEGSNGHD